MNNLKYYNDSLAYDFDRFMPRQKVSVAEELPKQNIIKMPKNNPKKRIRVATAHVSSGIFAVMATIALVATLCFNIALRIKVNEVNSAINASKSKLNTLKSESVALQMEYEEKVSFANLEMEAAALGMKKPDKNQIKYIRVNQNSLAKNANGETMVAQNN